MDLLTIKEAAERLGIAPQTLMNWRTRDYGPPSAFIGGRVKYRPDDIDAWINDRFKENSMDEFTIEVSHINDDYLVIQKTPGKQQILATCPYPKYADHVAEALREKGPLDG